MQSLNIRMRGVIMAPVETEKGHNRMSNLILLNNS